VRWPESWQISYSLLGLTQSGLVPVLMPLVAPHGTAAGQTFAAFSLLGICAPILGAWADRTGRHRDLMIWGMLGAGALLTLFELVAAPLRIFVAAGAGLGAMAATSAGNVIAIQGMPEAEWESRVALLQRFVSAGQVIGLASAGLLERASPGAGFIFAGVALLLAGTLAAASTSGRVPRETIARQRPRTEFGAYLSVINRPMRRFLAIWLIAYAAMNGFATLFPVAMTRQFAMSPILPSSVYAIGVLASVVLYPMVGAETHRRGCARILVAGFAARLLLLGLLAPLGLWQSAVSGWLVLLGFALIQFVWPLISVAANSLSVRLAPKARGESIGLFNATTALASAIGSAVSGMIYDWGGFAALAAVAFAVMGIGLLLAEFWLGTYRGVPISSVTGVALSATVSEATSE
jgi:MFS family permease